MKLNSRKKGVYAISLIISLFALFIITSCDKEEEASSNDSNYVRYEISGNGAYGRFSNWTATTPNGTYSNNGYQTASWSQTYEPVNRGFNCRVQIGNYISGPPTIEIHVSKNSEPFVLKVARTGSSASFTIN